MKKFAAVIIFVGAVFTLMFVYTAQQQNQEQSSIESFAEIPAPDMVTFVNLGADSCLPCQMMEPVIEELKETYKDQVKIAFIDVWKHTDQGQRFRITTIPTQIFYDHQGNETFRHQGYMDREAIVEVLEELLEQQNIASMDSSLNSYPNS